jgi:hypothetical protein
MGSKKNPEIIGKGVIRPETGSSKQLRSRLRWMDFSCNTYKQNLFIYVFFYISFVHISYSYYDVSGVANLCNKFIFVNNLY